MTLSDEQRKQIEREAEELWPERLFPSGAQRRAYAHGATTRALACQQKDEEIARLRSVLEIIAFPLIHLQKLAKEQGVALNGQYAISISNDANWLKNQAIEALKPIIP